MEPITILGSVNTLVSVSLGLGRSLNALHQKYNQAPRIINLLSTECTITNQALATIEQILSRKPEILNPDLEGGVDMAGRLELALTTWATTFSVLDTELARIKRSPRRIFQALRFVVNETTLNDLLRQLQGLRSSLNFLLDAFQRYL